MKLLVTGAAGFIGSAVCRRLLDRSGSVIRQTIDSPETYIGVPVKAKHRYASRLKK